MAEWFDRHLDAMREAGPRLLELGCGPGRDAVTLRGAGFEVVACDASERSLEITAGRFGTSTLLRVDHSRPLPFRDGAFDVVVASLSMHYFAWDVTVAAFAEVRRVLRAGGVLLFRVNATDDVKFGAEEGLEIAHHFRQYPPERGLEPFKRYFDQEDVLAALGRRFEVENIEHMTIDRYAQPKRVWECRARRQGTARMKRIIVCIDGTTNATEVVTGKRPTNVVLFTRALKSRDVDGHHQIVEYVPGVATDESAEAPGRFKASVDGRGFSQIVQEAYEFLCNNYEFGDRVYLLGFSRGAAAARSVSGLTELFGILPKAEMSHFREIWRFYNTSPAQRDLRKLRAVSAHLAQIAEVGMSLREAHESERGGGSASEMLSEFGHAPDFAIQRPYEPGQSPHGSQDPDRVARAAPYITLPLHFVGVWDTVYALLSKREGYHEESLAWNVGKAFHALAIHELRNPFKPTLWRAWCGHQTVVQCWFPGAHSDVGGGTDMVGLSSVSLRWMIHAAESDGLQFDWSYLDKVLYSAGKAVSPPNTGWEILAIPSRKRTFSPRDIRAPQYKHWSVDTRLPVPANIYSKHQGELFEADRRSARLPSEPMAALTIEAENLANRASSAITQANGDLPTLHDLLKRARQQTSELTGEDGIRAVSESVTVLRETALRIKTTLSTCSSAEVEKVAAASREPTREQISLKRLQAIVERLAAYRTEAYSMQVGVDKVVSEADEELRQYRRSQRPIQPFVVKKKRRAEGDPK